jgi:hypothetical protein
MPIMRRPRDPDDQSADASSTWDMTKESTDLVEWTASLLTPELASIWPDSEEREEPELPVATERSQTWPAMYREATHRLPSDEIEEHGGETSSGVQPTVSMPAMEGGRGEYWVNTVAMFTRRASSIRTVDSVHELTKAADVLSDLAHIMKRYAETRKRANDSEQDAEQARQVARRTAAAAAECREIAKQKETVAEEAERAARNAATEAAEARDSADRATKALSVAEKTEQDVAEASIAARELANELEVALTSALTANSAEAWSAALRVASESNTSPTTTPIWPQQIWGDDSESMGSPRSPSQLEGQLELPPREAGDCDPIWGPA